MAQYTKSISIVFNDNDGGMSHSINPLTRSDINSLYRKKGKLVGRFLLLRQFWLGLKRMEGILDVKTEKGNNQTVLRNGLDC